MTKKKRIRMLADAGIMLALATVLSLIQIFKMPFGGSVTLFSMMPLAIFAYRYDTKHAVTVAMLYGVIQMLIGLANFSYVKGVGSYIVVALFDYILAFGVLGFSGMFKKAKKSTAITVSSLLSLALIVLFTVALMSSDDTKMLAQLKSKWWIIAVEAGVVIILMAVGLALKNKVPASSVTIASGIAVSGVMRAICHIISGVTVWSGYAADRTAIMYSLYYNLSYMIPEVLITVVMAVIVCSLLDFDAEVLDVRYKDDSKVKKLKDIDKDDSETQAK